MGSHLLDTWVEAYAVPSLHSIQFGVVSVGDLPATEGVVLFESFLPSACWPRILRHAPRNNLQDRCFDGGSRTHI